jgi:uncharacterized membrane protein YkvA (DUF1232 family)
MGIAAILLSWVLLVAVAARLPEGALKDLVAFLPACATTARVLRADPRVPRRAKLAVGLALIWVLSPIDLIPEFLPVIGPLDDVVVVALAFRYAARLTPRSILVEAWPANPAVIERLLGARSPGWPSHKGSGCQSGNKSSNPNVNWRGRAPAAAITHTPMREPPRWALKAIRRPSGEKVGANSKRLVDVSLLRWVPSAATVQMFPFRENTSVAPSGCQSGRSSMPGPEVSWRGSVPSAPMTQMSSGPARLLVNAILVPSGDHSGKASNPRVLVSRLTRRPFEPMT